MFERPHRLARAVRATNIDDDERPRFPDDTELPAGIEFVVKQRRHSWPPHPDTELFYTIETRGARYNVAADDLEPAMET
ncbi:MAG: hypothetical protein M1436_03805 [Acidobacteria bacterium]|nr:hypothetical protein [Acidobacteriota bacterium]